MSSKKALLIVDLQNDFLPGGALAVENGDKVVPFIDQLLEQDWDVVVASKDWHPEEHGSFASDESKIGDVVNLEGLEQILWPPHCIQETKGAEFAEGWDTEKVEKVFYKGIDEQIDSYSTFFDNGHRRSTGLGDYLQGQGVDQVYLVGLATDYCVKYSALDALRLGFEVFVVKGGCRSVDLEPGDGEEALSDLERAGVFVI